MALNIKNDEAHRLAREISQETGRSITEVVVDALREARKNVKNQDTAREQALAHELDRLALHCSKLPLLDERGADEILGYDEHGLST